MIHHDIECTDLDCGYTTGTLLANAEPAIPPCPRCGGPRERHNGVRRTIFRSTGEIERVDARCGTCNDVETGLEVPAAKHEYTLPPCEICGAATQIVRLPPRVTWTAQPVVVFRDPETGTYRFPGDANGLSAANYARQGMERVELRNFADVRRFESHMNAQERSQAAIRVEHAHRGREIRESQTRSELFHRMKTFSNAGRDVAHAAIASGNRRAQERTHDPGFRVEVYSDDRGSREASRDERGHRRRD